MCAASTDGKVLQTWTHICPRPGGRRAGGEGEVKWERQGNGEGEEEGERREGKGVVGSGVEGKEEGEGMGRGTGG